jgi:hypothetical protein
MSNLGMGLIGPMGHIGLIGRKPVNNNRPAQRDSEISILKNRPLCPYCPLAFKIAPARRSSKNSILGMENIVPAESTKNTENAIFTKQVKNITGYFMGMEWNEQMSKMQSISAQLDSKMSNLKIETESSFPQRYSKMSNGRLSVLLCWTHGQKAMSITRIKNMDDWFMGTMVE